MSKPIYLFALLLVSFYSNQAATGTSLAFTCFTHVDGKKILPSSTFVYADGAEEIIKMILESMGLEASFEVKKTNVLNAAAVVYQGRRYVLYNPAFITAMNKMAGTSWASVAILAHEIGHHLNGHTLDGKGSLPSIELEADEFSGFVLRKMGASLSDAQLAIRIVASAKATSTHPAKNDRLMAIADGWNRADDLLKNRNVAIKKLRLLNGSL